MAKEVYIKLLMIFLSKCATSSVEDYAKIYYDETKVRSRIRSKESYDKINSNKLKKLY